MKNIIMYDKENKKLIYVNIDGDKPKLWQNKLVILEPLKLLYSVMGSFFVATIITFF